MSEVKFQRLGEVMAAGKVAVTSSNEVNCEHLSISALGDLTPFPSVRTLNLSFNPLTNLEGCDCLPNLRTLHAYCCLISSLDALSHCAKLETLNLQQNGVKVLGFGMLGLRNLRRARLDRNALTKLENLDSCAMLRFLDISFNNLTSLQGIAGLQCLEELRVNNNKLTSLSGLRALPSLKILSLARNQITSLEGLKSVFATLEVLSAEENCLSRLFKETAAKQSSHLQPSQPHETKSSFRGKLTSALSKASLTSTDSTVKSSAGAVHASKSDGMKCLTELNLSGNQLLSLEGFEIFGLSLETLNLSQNKLNSLGNLKTVLEEQGMYLIELWISSNPGWKDVARTEHEIEGGKEGEDGLHNNSDDITDIRSMVMTSCPNLIYVDEVKLRSANKQEAEEAGDGDDDASRLDETNHIDDGDYESYKEVIGSDTLKKAIGTKGLPSNKLELASDRALQEVVSADQLQAIELKFTTLLRQCKSLLKEDIHSKHGDENENGLALSPRSRHRPTRVTVGDEGQSPVSSGEWGNAASHSTVFQTALMESFVASKDADCI